MKRPASGLVTVEFAIIGASLLMVLIGCIEIGRVFFVWNTVAEGTRRAARLAAVCPVNHSSIALAAILSAPDGSSKSPFLDGLTTGEVSVQYLDSGGAVTATFANIRFVRVGISGYQHSLLIPFFTSTINVPAFSTTVPVESLGYLPEPEVRQCFGT